MRMVDVQHRHEWHAIESIENGPAHAVAVWSYGAGSRMLVSATAEPHLLTDKPLHRTSGAHGPGRWLGQCKNVHVGPCGCSCGNYAAACACRVCYPTPGGRDGAVLQSWAS